MKDNLYKRAIRDCAPERHQKEAVWERVLSEINAEKTSPRESENNEETIMSEPVLKKKHSWIYSGRLAAMAAAVCMILFTTFYMFVLKQPERSMIPSTERASAPGTVVSRGVDELSVLNRDFIKFRLYPVFPEDPIYVRNALDETNQIPNIMPAYEFKSMSWTTSEEVMYRHLENSFHRVEKEMGLELNYERMTRLPIQHKSFYQQEIENKPNAVLSIESKDGRMVIIGVLMPRDGVELLFLPTYLKSLRLEMPTGYTLNPDPEAAGTDLERVLPVNQKNTALLKALNQDPVKRTEAMEQFVHDLQMEVSQVASQWSSYLPWEGEMKNFAFFHRGLGSPSEYVTLIPHLNLAVNAGSGSFPVIDGEPKKANALRAFNSGFRYMEFLHATELIERSDGSIQLDYVVSNLFLPDTLQETYRKEFNISQKSNKWNTSRSRVIGFRVTDYAESLKFLGNHPIIPSDEALEQIKGSGIFSTKDQFALTASSLTMQKFEHESSGHSYYLPAYHFVLHCNSEKFDWDDSLLVEGLEMYEESSIPDVFPLIRMEITVPAVSLESMDLPGTP